jgi:O-methyltransferase
MNETVRTDVVEQVETGYAHELHLFRRSIVDCVTRIRLTELKPGFPHEPIVPKATFAPWRSDSAFLNLYSNVKDDTLVDIYRLYGLYQLAGSCDATEGDFLEVGVWRGGTAAVIGMQAQKFVGSKLWLADTFVGVANASERDSIYKGGEHADTTKADVERVLKRCGIGPYEILEGVFPEETGSTLAAQHVKLRFVHIDVDTYTSARNTFEWAWPRTVPGGFIVFDDYGFWGCEGVAQFVESLKALKITVIYNLNGHAIVPKFRD